MPFTFTASADGLKRVKCALWIIVSGSSKSMDTRGTAAQLNGASQFLEVGKA
uniref:Uncharacterized protein n=1 Tax=Daucus carota subsp. sativus TaxID=79200 RepID=A0A164V836_DAUCS